MKVNKVEFYDEFECMGGNCPLTCCGGWTILIDRKTYKSYRKMGSHIAKFAKKNIVPYTGTDDYYIKKILLVYVLCVIKISYARS